MNITANEVASKCLKRWGIDKNDRVISEFLGRLPLFLGEFDAPIELNLVTDLIDDFEYYSREKIADCFQQLYNQMKKRDSFDAERTILCAISYEDGSLNSSYEYVSYFQWINDIEKKWVFSDIDKINVDVWQYVDTIVFIDDINGSGRTIYEFLSRHRSIIEDKSIIYVVIHTMQEALETLLNRCEEENYNLRVYYGTLSNKAFIGKREGSKSLFNIISREHGIWGNNTVFGFDDSQSLVAFYNNTPNNTLGIFSRDTDNHKSLFPRRKRRLPPWEKKRQRSIDNQNRIKN